MVVPGCRGDGTFGIETIGQDHLQSLKSKTLTSKSSLGRFNFYSYVHVFITFSMKKAIKKWLVQSTFSTSLYTVMNKNCWVHRTHGRVVSKALGFPRPVGLSDGMGCPSVYRLRLWRIWFQSNLDQYLVTSLDINRKLTRKKSTTVWLLELFGLESFCIFIYRTYLTDSCPSLLQPIALKDYHLYESNTYNY